VNLLEAVAGVAILGVVATGALAATAGSARVSVTPVDRDRSTLAARNAFVEARAAAAYDDNAVAAILASQPASWTSGGIRLESAIVNGVLTLTATSNDERAQMQYAPLREAIPQGSILTL
jgi:hypothetical protein